MNDQQQKELLRDVLRGVRELAEALDLPPTEALKEARNLVMMLRAAHAAKSKEQSQCQRS